MYKYGLSLIRYKGWFAIKLNEPSTVYILVYFFHVIFTDILLGEISIY